MSRTGRKSVVGVALALIGALALAVPGVAGTKTNTGKIDGDANSKVIAKVKVEKGKPTKLTRLSIRQLDYFCGGYPEPTGELDLEFTDVKVKKRGAKYKFSIALNDQSGRRGASGTVKKNGAKVEGSTTYSFLGCKADGTFTAKR